MVNRKNPESSLPPGFRFHPTDEELILHYLKKKITSSPFPVSIIADVDIYKCDPWDLPAKATFGEKEWYFFSPRDRKYPNGARPNRAAASGYWKATGTDKIIMAPPSMAEIGGRGIQENIGVKKALVFYRGRPPKGVKTNWIMHEYRLADSPNNFNNNKPMKPKESSMRLDDWVLCRIYQKTNALSSMSTSSPSDQEQEEEEQFFQDTLLPILRSPPIPHDNGNTLKSQKSTSFSNLLDAMDYSMLTSFLSDNPMNQTGYESAPTFPSGFLDQTFTFNNCTNNSNSYYLNPENKLKRPHSGLDENMLHPPKKCVNSCNFTNNSGSTDQSDAQYNFLNQTFLNQQLALSPHLQFLG